MTPWIVLGVVALLLAVLAIGVARRRADRELAARDAAEALLLQAAEISESIRIWANHPDSARLVIWADLVEQCWRSAALAQDLAASAPGRDQAARVSDVATVLSHIAEQLQHRDTPPYDDDTFADLLSAVERLDGAADALHAGL